MTGKRVVYDQLESHEMEGLFSPQSCQACIDKPSLLLIELVLSLLVPSKIQIYRRKKKELSYHELSLVVWRRTKLAENIPFHSASPASMLPPVLPCAFHVLAAILAYRSILGNKSRTKPIQLSAQMKLTFFFPFQ